MKTKRTITACLIAVIVFFSVLPAGTGYVYAAGYSDPEKVEGKGFDTPEEAILAYAQALKNEDLEELLQTCAVESYCDNFDPMRQIRRSLSFVSYYYDDYPVPAKKGSLNEALNIERRRRNLVSRISKEMLVLTEAENGYYSTDDESDDILRKILDGSLQTFKKDADGEKAIKKLGKELAKSPDLSEMQIGEILYGESLSENYLTFNNLSVLYSTACIAGADAIKSLALHCSLDDYDLLLFADIVKYNDKWYILSPGSNISVLGGLPVYYQGLATIGPDIAANWKKDSARFDKNLAEAKENFSKSGKKEWETHQKDTAADADSSEDDDFFEDYKAELSQLSFDEMTEFFALTELTD